MADEFRHLARCPFIADVELAGGIGRMPFLHGPFAGAGGPDMAQGSVLRGIQIAARSGVVAAVVKDGQGLVRRQVRGGQAAQGDILQSATGEESGDGQFTKTSPQFIEGGSRFDVYLRHIQPTVNRQ